MLRRAPLNDWRGHQAQDHPVKDVHRAQRLVPAEDAARGCDECPPAVPTAAPTQDQLGQRGQHPRDRNVGGHDEIPTALTGTFDRHQQGAHLSVTPAAGRAWARLSAAAAAAAVAAVAW